jgi:tryptophanyl-tRNA synthetase
MSKSYNNYLGLLDDQQTIIKKIKAITTNALTVDQPKNPDQCNVYNIIRLFLSPEEDINLRKKYES